MDIGKTTEMAKEIKKCGGCKGSNFNMKAIKTLVTVYVEKNGNSFKIEGEKPKETQSIEYVSCLDCGKIFDGSENDFFTGYTCAICEQIVENVDNDNVCADCMKEISAKIKALPNIEIYRYVLGLHNKNEEDSAEIKGMI